MNPEVKAKWITALRSGEFQQTKGKLRASDGDSHSYCCLGVLCELHAQETHGNWNADDSYLNEQGILPPPVLNWAGVESVFGGNIPIPSALDRHFSFTPSLTELNDTGSTFAQIADGIENFL